MWATYESSKKKTLHFNPLNSEILLSYSFITDNRNIDLIIVSIPLFECIFVSFLFFIRLVFYWLFTLNESFFFLISESAFCFHKFVE